MPSERRQLPCAAPLLLDMHEIGDMLDGHGFYDPVTDTAKLELTYRKPETFRQEITTPVIFHAAAFFRSQAARDYINAIFTAKGRLNIIPETVYGHVVKKPAPPEGESPVRFYPYPHQKPDKYPESGGHSTSRLWIRFGVDHLRFKPNPSVPSLPRRRQSV